MTIDIIRRDTLAASQIIASPLERLTAHYHIGQLELVPDPDPGPAPWLGTPDGWADPPDSPEKGEPAA